VNTILRFEGIILTNRNDLRACTDRIADKVSEILDPTGANDQDGAQTPASKIVNPMHEDIQDNSSKQARGAAKPAPLSAMSNRPASQDLGRVENPIH
jgi:hypothetical protein